MTPLFIERTCVADTQNNTTFYKIRSINLDHIHTASLLSLSVSSIQATRSHCPMFLDRNRGTNILIVHVDDCKLQVPNESSKRGFGAKTLKSVI